MNPWGLTDLEAAWMDAMLELYSIKLASAAMGVSLIVGQSRMRNCRRRMGKGKPLQAIQACIAWHDWTRQHAETLCMASRDGFCDASPNV